MEEEFNLLTATIEVEMYGKVQGREVGWIDTAWAIGFGEEKTNV